jgi:hypothetical protein
VNKEIKVYYLHGITRKDFLELENLGYEVEIPEEKKEIPAYAHILEPDDYILIFSIYFSYKIVEEIAKGVAKKLISNFSKTITGIWKKFKGSNPSILVSGKEPDYKLPKAVLRFQISEDEETTIEITNEISSKELEKLLEFQLKLIKIQYKHRKKEADLKRKIKK